MPSTDDKLGALFLLAATYKGPVTIELSNGYYIVTFLGTVANLMFAESDTTMDEINKTITEARRS
jgi:hypothetical protein